MADAKISALTALTTLTDADVFPVVDDADTTTKKITAANVKTYMAPPVGNTHIVGTVTGYVLPGMVPSTTSNEAVVANRTYFTPWTLFEARTLTEVAIKVQTAGAGTWRIGLYSADAGWQPTSTLAVDFGTVSTSTTGVKTIASLSQAMPAGRYVAVINGDIACTLTVLRAHSSVAAQMWSDPWGNSVYDVRKNTQNLGGGAFPSTPVAYDTTQGGGVGQGFSSFVTARFT